MALCLFQIAFPSHIAFHGSPIDLTEILPYAIKENFFAEQ